MKITAQTPAKQRTKHSVGQVTRHIQANPMPPLTRLASITMLLAVALSLAPLARAAAPAGSAMVTHELEVTLAPGSGEITATDQLRLPQPQREIEFSLHRDLRPELISPGQLRQIGTQGHLINYRVQPPAPSDQIRLRYQGRIRHALQGVHEGMGRSRQQSPGTIAENGVFLTGFTGWYPRIPGTMETFNLWVDLPLGWLAVSQGEGPNQTSIETTKGALTRVQWQESHPQDEIYLIAAPFAFYQQDADGIQIQAWLRAKDATLAEPYMAAAGEYLQRYSRLIGDYPYAKFALVENFWETGYGMPSFTLLGPRVLRLPFILHSSYPHEILHNWWGNGVFVDWDQGNWSEGLTAYLADHLNQALAGQGSQYRHDQLKAYADYVSAHAEADAQAGADDTPLSAFRARHDQASQAIGYGKSLMVFHMLRQQLGDQNFIAGLRRFYADNRFRAASWKDVQTAFESASGRDLAAFFSAWVQRPGAVRLNLQDVQSQQEADGRYQVSGLVRQVQSAAPFPLKVPVVLHDSRGQPHEMGLDFTGERELPFSFTFDQPPLRLAVDPLFDSFRVLEPGETPVSLSNLFGAPSGTLILPAQAAPELRHAYRQLAEGWQRGQAQWRIVQDADIQELPAGAVWLFGWENRWLSEFSHASPDFSLDIDEQAVQLSGQSYRDQSPVLTRDFRNQHSDSGLRPIGWLAADNPDAISGLARKLPHYGKYGYLVFSGPEPTNQLKGQWSVHDSPLIHWFQDQAPETLSPVKRRSLLTQISNARQAPPHSAPAHQAW